MSDQAPQALQTGQSGPLRSGRSPGVSRFGLALAGIVLLGVALRVVYAYAIARSKPLQGDALEFEAIARLIAAGHGYIQLAPWFSHRMAIASADKPPVFPLLEAAITALGGDSWRWHHLIGIASGAGTITVVGLIGRRLAGSRTGLIAAGLASVYPVLIATDGSLRSESVFALTISLVLLAALWLRAAPSAGRAALLGALIGLAALTRTEALLLLVLLPFGLGGPRRAALAVLACALVIAPWFVRCWIAFGQPVLISTNVGTLVAGANCEQAYSGELIGQWSFSCVIADGTTLPNEAKNSRRLLNVGLRYARHHAGRLPVVIAARVGRTFELFRPLKEATLEALAEGRNLRVAEAGLAMYYVLAVLAIAGAAILRRRRGPLLVLLSPLMLVLVVSITSYGVTRFRTAAEPSLILLATLAIEAAISSRGGWLGRWRWPGAGGARPA